MKVSLEKKCLKGEVPLYFEPFLLRNLRNILLAMNITSVEISSLKVEF